MQKYFVWITVHRKLGDIRGRVFQLRLDCTICQICGYDFITCSANCAHRWSCCYCHSDMCNNGANSEVMQIKNRFAWPAAIF